MTELRAGFDGMNLENEYDWARERDLEPGVRMALLEDQAGISEIEAVGSQEHVDPWTYSYREPMELDLHFTLDDSSDREDIWWDQETYERPDPEPLHTKRIRKLPSRYENFRLSAQSSVFKPGQLEDGQERTQLMEHFKSPPPPPPPSTPPVAEPQPPSPKLPSKKYIATSPNSFGTYRVFEDHLPSLDPEELSTFKELVNGPAPDGDTPRFGGPRVPKKITNPFSNETTQLLMSWFQESGLSIRMMDTLVLKVILHSSFKRSDLKSFSVTRELRRIDQPEKSNLDDLFLEEDGWVKGEVSFPVPCAGHKFESEKDAPHFTVKNVYYRDPLKAMESLVKSKTFVRYVLRAYKFFWDPMDGRPVQRLYGEAYTSDRGLELQRKVDRRVSGDQQLEAVPLFTGYYSDSTVVSNFSNRSLWPGYFWIGNQPKFDRLKRTSHAIHTFAYLPSLPDHFGAWYIETYGRKPTDAVVRHCKRELTQAVWAVIFNAQFKETYQNGAVWECYDEIQRLFFPLHHTWTADYLEKIVLACIKFLGTCLCANCLVKRSQVAELGTDADMKLREKKRRVDTKKIQQDLEKARRYIYEQGYSVESDKVKGLLDGRSQTPNRNAFSSFLRGIFGDSFYELFCVEIMHDFEAGEWLKVLKQLIRLLKAYKDFCESEFNARFRKIPSFGRGTIRRFYGNVSDLKRKGASDHEDVLQVIMPCIEGLFPEPHNSEILDLIFDLQNWHAHAKLRLHTDATLQSFSHATKEIGKALRLFASTTSKAYETKELPHELESRVRTQLRQEKQDVSNIPRVTGYSRPTWYKFHALGHYVEHIQRYGTTDSFSAQRGFSSQAYIHYSKHFFIWTEYLK
ncbi:hypothetical protein VKT23_002754 [Stygiomarasmius scandens]|uniref:Uncharacterized protein n=1 Tax=Marasmiellus scandens TaxID=2682957 RepID=A0ABR1JY83_9AGAR